MAEAEAGDMAMPASIGLAEIIPQAKTVASQVLQEILGDEEFTSVHSTRRGSW